MGELSKAMGLDVETIRCGVNAALLPGPLRSMNGYRAYAPQQLGRLAFIRHGRVLDIPLSGMQSVLESVRQANAECARIDYPIDEQPARLRARSKSMRALEKTVAALRAHCGTRHAARDRGILGELVAAAHGETCACHDPVTQR